MRNCCKRIEAGLCITHDKKNALPARMIALIEAGEKAGIKVAEMDNWKDTLPKIKRMAEASAHTSSTWHAIHIGRKTLKQ
jgi:hypothetical protein